MGEQTETSFSASLRESRMVIERLLQYKGIPSGRRPSVTDAGLYSASMGLSGFERLLEMLDRLSENIAVTSELSETPDGLSFDAGDKHAWLVAEEITDLLVDNYKRQAPARINVMNVACPAELQVVKSLIQKHGLGADVKYAGDVVVITLTEADQPVQSELLRICHERIPVDRDLWFALFHKSNEALAPDTKASRMHTGTVILTEDGKVVGANDDEFLDMDLSILEKDILEEPGMEEGKH
ncbi:MAG: hypothetical protein CL814_09595 [Confluentimicrobium sp.]|jgi:hypothetical protein|nr:hypothetical protein [Actibacterium sp.]|tara:strand:- start:27861 stop:28580 length:720 start_codon:yes stop_codon:yes gene_type:complete